jgi:hypothetical protein
MTDEHLRKVYILMSSMWRNEEELGVREQYRWGCRKDWDRILNRASHKRAGSIALRTIQAQVLLTSLTVSSMRYTTRQSPIRIRH